MGLARMALGKSQGEGPEGGVTPAAFSNLAQQAEALGVLELQDVQHVLR